MTRHLSSEQARAHWRETLDAVAAGERIVIERYGRPVAVLAPYAEGAAAPLREPGPVYDSNSYERLKTDVVAEVIAELGAGQMEPVPWLEGLTKLQELVKESGSPFTDMTTDEIVTKMRQTRREVVEEMYGHLYR